jgi:hypothetical protein
MTEERPTKIVVNCETGVTEILPLTDDEMAEREQMAIESEAQRVLDEQAAQALADLKASAIGKLVAGTPLTVEEAATLVL